MTRVIWNETFFILFQNYYLMMTKCVRCAVCGVRSKNQVQWFELNFSCDWSWLLYFVLHGNQNKMSSINRSTDWWGKKPIFILFVTSMQGVLINTGNGNKYVIVNSSSISNSDEFVKSRKEQFDDQTILNNTFQSSFNKFLSFR